MLNKSLYSKTHNVEFFHITKNAMTAIIRDMGMSWYERSTLPSNRKIFCVIRDPLKRVLSGFNEIKKLYGMGVREHTFRELKVETENKIFKNPNIIESFEGYICEMEQNGLFDSHNQTQYDFLEGYTVKTLFDVPRNINDIQHFLRFEDIDSELTHLIGKPFKLNRVNNGNKNIKDTIKPVLSSYEDRVRELYKVDYELYER